MIAATLSNKPLMKGSHMFNQWNIAFWEYEYFAPLWFMALALLPFAYFLWKKNERETPGFLKFTGKPTEQSAFSSRWIPILRSIIVLSYLLSLGLVIVAMTKPYHPES